MRGILIIGAAFAWFAVVSQFFLTYERSENAGAAIGNYFSYFTILTNLLLAFYYLVELTGDSKLRKWLDSAGFSTALAVYLTVVGTVYHVALSAIWSPEGLQFITDQVLHTFDPVYYLLYWVLFARKARLKWNYAYRWLLYPLLYTVYTFIRGSVLDAYPYPFVDVNMLGYQQVIINTGIILLIFLALSFIFIWMGKSIVQRFDR